MNRKCIVRLECVVKWSTLMDLNFTKIIYWTCHLLVSVKVFFVSRTKKNYNIDRSLISIQNKKIYGDTSPRDLYKAHTHIYEVELIVVLSIKFVSKSNCCAFLYIGGRKKLKVYSNLSAFSQWAFLWVYWFIIQLQSIFIPLSYINDKVKDFILIHLFMFIPFRFFSHRFPCIQFLMVSRHAILFSFKKQICVNCMMNIVQLHVLNLLPSFHFIFCVIVSSTCTVTLLGGIADVSYDDDD